MKVKYFIGSCAVIASMSFGTVAQASGIPVFDGAAAANAVQNLVKWAEQLKQMQSQLDQAKQLYASMNGIRGMGSILNNPELRNYLPADWQKVYDSVKTGGYNGLTDAAKAIRDNNQVYDNCAHQTGSAQAICYRQAAQSAQYKDFVGQALASSQKRLNQIQSLMNTINTTTDAKAIAELQARISSEQATIANEATQMQLFKMMADAEQQLVSQQQREGAAKSTRRIQSSSVLR